MQRRNTTSRLCEQCGKSVAANNYDRHVREMHTERDRQHTCPICGTVAGSTRLYQMHVRRCEQHARVTRLLASLEPVAPTLLPPPSDVAVCACGRTWQNAERLQHHIDRDHGGVEPTEGQPAGVVVCVPRTLHQLTPAELRAISPMLAEVAV